MLRDLERKILQRIEGSLAKRFAIRHPTRTESEMIRYCAPLVRRMVPNDRWSLEVHAPHLARAACLPCPVPARDPLSIALFVAFRGEFAMGLALAAILAWRGHRVTIVYLPRLQSPSKQPIVDSADAGNYLRRSLREVAVASGGRIECSDITEISDPRAPVDSEFLATRVHLDTVMALRRELLDPADPTVAFCHTHYSALGEQVQRAVHCLLDKASFDLFLVPNGATYAAAHVVHLLKRRRLPFSCFDKFSVRDHRLVNHDGNIMELGDIDAIWKERNSLGFLAGPQLDRATAAAMSMLDERRRGAMANWATQTQAGESQGAAAARAAIGLTPGEPFVLIATNVPFDAGLAEITTLFPSMRIWLIETLRRILGEGASRVVVKTHPDEARWAANETAADIIRAAGIDSSRFILVTSRAVNTYDLIEASAGGIVFSSTVGLEMAMLGKPVLLGSRVYYSGKGFTIDAASREEYYAKLSELIAGPGRFALPQDQVQAARLYHYLLHRAVQWPFPFQKPSDLRQDKLQRLLLDGGMDGFLPTLDALCARGDQEWIATVARDQGWVT